MKHFTSFKGIAQILVGLLLVVLGYSVISQVVGPVDSKENKAQPVAEKLRNLLPKGPQIYSIAQADDQWPRMTQAKIDPVDTHLGVEQTLEVIVESRTAIDRVFAEIETDNGIKVLELELVGDAPITKAPASFALIEGYTDYSQPSTLVKKANAQEIIRKLYRNSWIVDDVHDAKYYTTFVAQSGGDESRVTLAWSDACSIPAGGSWSLSSHGNCTISAKDGVDNGNATINTNTLTLNADFAVNSGRTLTITSGGTIALCASCKILFTNIWQTDQDADTFPLNATMSLQDTAPTNGKRRNTLAIPLDCDDTDADVKPTQTSYFTTQAGGGGYDYNCDSTTTKSPTEWLYDWTEDNNGNFCQCNDQLYEPLPAYLTCGSKYREAECQDGQFLGDPCGHSGGGLDPNGPYTVSCH